ncbi:hypothetical protein MIV012R [Invertebrate iridescent virus 3]|uniref:Putative zinc finger protein 012R n=1 Tax=Invertebrate iridescent virus 3 TaxID=345201 RepID=VF302_IIV3|nr:hypothetical protein MIV012R [Invertebrate iridescent virus 3]Q197E8.1 RecName: Full=Putative zinc finger protein 012R [Invertebrate iridescent virus 3]ABF82042.1 hypothetical protein MIV012R [Invertebrate iridescent virus 3]
MFECTHCDLHFESKSKLATHQKTKKCTAHRFLGFTCQKCWDHVKGYENALNHVAKCGQKLQTFEGIQALVAQLALHYKCEVVFDHENGKGQINFQKVFNYTHPSNLQEMREPIEPRSMHVWYKMLRKYSDQYLLGGHGLYLNDINYTLFRLSDAFKFLAAKYDARTLLKMLWIEPTYKLFHVKDGIVYVLGKIQSQTQEGRKWFGDTFCLQRNETIVKCLWYRDPTLEQLWSNTIPLLKEILNLYLDLGTWLLKRKNIKLKNDHKIHHNCKTIIENVFKEYDVTNLIENITVLNSRQTFTTMFREILTQHQKDLRLPSNIHHVFKDDLLPSSLGGQEFSLMTMTEQKISGGNQYHLMYHILPESERPMFETKI